VGRFDCSSYPVEEVNGGIHYPVQAVIRSKRQT